MNITGKFIELHKADIIFWPQVLELDSGSFPRPWKISDWESLNWSHHILVISALDQELRGFALFSLIPGDETVHLLKICIKKSYRGSSEAQFFWNEITDYLKDKIVKEVFLEVEAPNLAAIKFYQKVGFVSLRTIKSFYSDGADALTMNLTL
jgi:ribosomal-protein-alanine N-acetyltransferase